MRLMRGATGFRASTEPPLPLVDVGLLRGLCFDAARVEHARVGPWREAGTCTFHSVSIASQLASCVALFHAHLPLVAFAVTPPSPGQPIVGFADPPSWAGTFEAGGLRLLGPLTLDRSIADVDLGGLSCAELDQVSYWRPRSLGDLLFNWWD
ncbi:hypothetical protein ABIA32_002228 [Streptacidiphilus sp. MAP12-20]